MAAVPRAFQDLDNLIRRVDGGEINGPEMRSSAARRA